MKKWIMLLIAVILTSCAVNLNKISKTMMKKNNIEKVNYLREKIFENPKAELDTKSLALQSIIENEFLIPEINDYLRDELFPSESNLNLKNQIFDVIVKMNFPSNSEFFWQQIDQKTAYESKAYQALKIMGLEGFTEWRYRMKNPDMSEKVHKIFKKEKAWIKSTIDYYLALPDSQAVLLNEYLIENQDLVIEDIVYRIQQKEINDYESIRNIVELYDHFSISDYDVLLDETEFQIFDIVKNIYLHYVDKVFLNLHMLYTSSERLDTRLRIIELNRFLAEDKYIDNLEKYVIAPQTDIEEKKLIEALVELHGNYPQVFDTLLGKSDFFFNLKLYIPGFLSEHYQEFKTAFNNSDNLGKINILDYLFDTQNYEVVNDFLKEIDFKRYISEELQYIWNFVSIKTIEHDIFPENLENIVKDMLLVDNLITLQTASLIISSHFEVFEDYLIEQLTHRGTSLDKWEILVDLFENSRKESTFEFLISKMSEMKQRNSDIVTKKIASALGANRNFDYFTLVENTDLEIEKWKIALIVKYIYSEHIGHSKLNDYLTNNFFEFTVPDRAKIIANMQQMRNEDLLDFFINNYDNLEISEQMLVNASLDLFTYEKMIENHLRKLLIRGNQDHISLVEDFIEVNSLESVEIDRSLKNRYFRDYDFDKYDQINLSEQLDSDLIFKNIADIYRKSQKFSDRYSKEKLITLAVPDETVKSIADSLILYSEILDNPLVNEDKNKASEKVKKYSDDLNNLSVQYANFLSGLDSNEVFMNNFFVEVINSYYQEELQIGRMILKPESGARFVKVLLKTTNPGELDVKVYPENFRLICNGTPVKPAKEGDIYLEYIRNENLSDIPAGTSEYINLFFSMPFEYDEFELDYSIRDNINIIEKIPVYPENKEYINGSMREY